MSFVLRLNGAQVAISAAWHPALFGQRLGTSFPRVVDQSYSWSDARGYSLAWEADAPPPPPTQAEIDAEARRIADEAAASVAKADSVVQYLRDHTPAECEAYVQSNVTDLASARQLLKKFAVALCVLAKQNLR